MAHGLQIVEVRVDSKGRAVKHRLFSSGWAVDSGTPQQSYWGERAAFPLVLVCQCCSPGAVQPRSGGFSICHCQVWCMPFQKRW